MCGVFISLCACVCASVCVAVLLPVRICAGSQKYATKNYITGSVCVRARVREFL